MEKRKKGFLTWKNGKMEKWKNGRWFPTLEKCKMEKLKTGNPKWKKGKMEKMKNGNPKWKNGKSVEQMNIEKYKSRQTPQKPSVLTAPANRAEKVSMSRIKEMVLGAFWGPGGPKLVFERQLAYFLEVRWSIFCEFW